MNDLAKTMFDLMAVSARINQASDLLNASVQRIEESLARLNLGASAYVEVDDDGLLLGYATARNAKWGLVIENLGTSWPFCDAPRHLRILAVGSVGELLVSILEEAQRTTRRVEEVIEEADRRARMIEEAVKSTATEVR